MSKFIYPRYKWKLWWLSWQSVGLIILRSRVRTPLKANFLMVFVDSKNRTRKMSSLDKLRQTFKTNLPNSILKIQELNEKATTGALNSHGYIFGLGFASGYLQIFNSFSFYNDHVLEGHHSSITSISFSRDTNYLISGDKNGLFLIHKITIQEDDNHEPIFSHQFECGIKELNYHKKIHNEAYILLNNGKLYVFNQSNLDFKPIEGKFNAVCWANLTLSLITAYSTSCSIISIPDMNIILTFEFPKKKKSIRNLKQICISKDDEVILLIDGNGTGRSYNLKNNTDVAFIDSVNNVHYNTCNFSRNDKYGIFGIKSGDSIIHIWNAKSNEVKPRKTFPRIETNEAPLKILVHPLQPTFFVLFSKYIYVLGLDARSLMLNSIDSSDMIFNNFAYKESEREFDKSFIIGEELQEETVFTHKLNEKYFHENERAPLLPDDDAYPDQIIKFPFTFEKKK